MLGPFAPAYMDTQGALIHPPGKPGGAGLTLAVVVPDDFEVIYPFEHVLVAWKFPSATSRGG